jgi:hypothetical protein
MKTHFAILTAALMLSSGFALAQQQQYDSLGSPTPALQPNASPTAPQPNVPIPNPNLNKSAVGMNGEKEKSVTTGSGTASGNTAGASTGVDAPNNNGGSTPSGLIDD